MDITFLKFLVTVDMVVSREQAKFIPQQIVLL